MTAQFEFNTLSPVTQEQQVECLDEMPQEVKEFLDCVVEMLISLTCKDKAALEGAERVEE